LAAACGGDDSSPDDGGAATITVFAASSLTDAFGELGKAFEAQRAAAVELNFLSSSDLATQIEQGAPADVFASADEANMERVVDAGRAAGVPAVFARNRLAIAVRPGNPEGIGALEDLGDESLVVSLCNEECPAGRYALEAFETAGVEVEPDSLESEVKAVVTRVATGEADAGVVYATDVTAAGGEIEGVAISPAHNVIATYPIVVLEGAPAAARGFVDLVMSPEGRDVLRRHGFRAG
jgi:molybdate transport system substrate-binding protein